MLKLKILPDEAPAPSQPPSGGCVLKQETEGMSETDFFQPPSGGCVLKPVMLAMSESAVSQPPSGGCVLKL